MDRNQEARVILKKWLDLGERMLSDHITRLDANRAFDFTQGVAETRDFFEKVESK